MEQWIIDNLKKYGNTVIPNYLLNKFEKIDLELLLSEMIGQVVKIRSTKMWEADLVYGKRSGIYIAERIDYDKQSSIGRKID